VSWNDAVQFLQSDPRFNHPSLNPHDKRRLFEVRIQHLSGKRANDLDQLFRTHATSLDIKYDDIYPKIVEDFTVKRLGLQGSALEDRFKAWHRTREAEARREFDEMLGENSFVEFWGRMRKKKLDEGALKVAADEMEEGEGLGEGGAADLTALAKQIDLDEIKSVLRVGGSYRHRAAELTLQRDGRYRQFDHVPELREQWLRVSGEIRLVPFSANIAGLSRTSRSPLWI
jgi:transcription elongation regulator 1